MPAEDAARLAHAERRVDEVRARAERVVAKLERRALDNGFAEAIRRAMGAEQHHHGEGNNA